MLSLTSSHHVCKPAAVILILWVTVKMLSRTIELRTLVPVASLARPNVAKVSVLYGEENENYERAVASHERHARLHNYPLHVLRGAVADGYWNKELYLLSILIQELGKPTSERVEWLMYASGMLHASRY